MKHCLALLFMSLAFPALSAPKAERWDYWDVNQPQSQQIVDHSTWQALLDRYLITQDQNTLFLYSQVSSSDKQRLHDYLSNLTTQDPRQLNQAQQFAYWVNLYNALTVNLILEHYPITSITKLGGLFSFGPWDQDITTINGKALTLNDIEHRILRPIWQDKRIHYVVNCASLGCPNLLPTAFTATNTEQLLTQAESAFVHSLKGVEVVGSKLQLSSIYEWYATDFGGEAGVLSYLETLRPEIGDTNKKPSYRYNWDLNSIKY